MGPNDEQDYDDQDDFADDVGFPDDDSDGYYQDDED